MSSLVRGINGAVGWVFDLLVTPFASQPWLAMVVISAITAAWALKLFKWATPQARLDATRDRLFGHIYEMGLYQDHLKVLGRIQGRMALANLRYLSLTLPALLVLALPMVLTLGQLEGRFGNRPLAAGEETVLTVQLDENLRREVGHLELEVPAGVRIAAGPVRNERTGTVAWRIAALENGRHTLSFARDGEAAGSLVLPVGGGLPLLHDRTEESFWNLLLYPGSLALDDARGLAGVSVQWPERHTAYLGFEMHWLLAFMVFSLVAGLLLKDPLDVSL